MDGHEIGKQIGRLYDSHVECNYLLDEIVSLLTKGRSESSGHSTITPPQMEWVMRRYIKFRESGK